jgi:CubicO group peptidase (beta-lactamase class C family)
MRLLPLLLAAVAISPSLLQAQLNADTVRQINRVFTEIDRTDAPGCVLGVNRGGQPLYRRGYGMASLEFGVPMHEHSVVESGSVAKQFTAGAIVHLALAGKLSLEDPVRKHVPELPEYDPASPITIRMLLNHTSGLRDMWTLFTVAGQTMGSVLFRMEQALEMVYRQRELNFPPNTQYLYSNSGYLLLAEIVRRVSGKSLADYSAENIFRPLGMTRTQWRNDWNRLVPGRVTAYGGNPTDGWRVEMPFMSVYGAGGLLSTVGDMLAWNDNLDSPTVGGRAWVDSLERPGKLTSGRTIDYALGLIIGKYRGEREVQHTGATGGYRTYLGRLPDRKLSLAVLCNFGSANPELLAHRVADVFIGPQPAAVTASAAGPAGNGAGAADLAPYTGRFRAPTTEELLSLSVKDDRLVAFGGAVRLTMVGPDRFTAGDATALIFHRDAGARVNGASLVMVDRDTTRYERVDPPRSVPAEIAGFAGDFYSAELDVTYQLRANDTTLMLRIPGQAEVALARTAAESFSGPMGTGFRFSRGKSNRIDGFALFAGRVRNLRFTKRIP